MTTAQEPLTSASFHPSSSPLDHFPESPRTNEPTNNSNIPASSVFIDPTPLPERCQFTFSDGRQCRMPRHEIHVCLCRYHARREEELWGDPESATARELDGLCTDLTTATGVNRALAQVFRMLAQKRVNQRDAVAFGYLGQLLLQTVDGVRAESVAAFGYKAWTSQLRSTLSPQPADSSDTAACDPQATPLTLSAQASSAQASNDGSLSTGPVPGKPLPRGTNSANPTDSAAPANASATSAFSAPNYADLLSRSLDLFDCKYDTTPEGRREARALLLELELMTPREPKPPSKRLGVHYEPFPKPKGTRAVVIEHLRQQLHARSDANASQSTVAENAPATPVDCALTDH